MGGARPPGRAQGAQGRARGAARRARPSGAPRAPAGARRARGEAAAPADQLAALDALVDAARGGARRSFLVAFFSRVRHRCGTKTENNAGSAAGVRAASSTTTASSRSERAARRVVRRGRPVRSRCPSTRLGSIGATPAQNTARGPPGVRLRRCRHAAGPVPRLPAGRRPAAGRAVCFPCPLTPSTRCFETASPRLEQRPRRALCTPRDLCRIPDIWPRTRGRIGDAPPAPARAPRPAGRAARPATPGRPRRCGRQRACTKACPNCGLKIHNRCATCPGCSCSVSLKRLRRGVGGAGPSREYTVRVFVETIAITGGGNALKGRGPTNRGRAKRTRPAPDAPEPNWDAAPGRPAPPATRRRRRSRGRGRAAAACGRRTATATPAAALGHGRRPRGKFTPSTRRLRVPLTAVKHTGDRAQLRPGSGRVGRERDHRTGPGARFSMLRGRPRGKLVLWSSLPPPRVLRHKPYVAAAPGAAVIGEAEDAPPSSRSRGRRQGAQSPTFRSPAVLIWEPP